MAPPPNRSRTSRPPDLTHRPADATAATPSPDWARHVPAQLFERNARTRRRSGHWPEHAALMVLAEHLTDVDLAFIAAQAATRDPESARWYTEVAPFRCQLDMIRGPGRPTREEAALTFAFSGHLPGVFEQLDEPAAEALLRAELAAVYEFSPTVVGQVWAVCQAGRPAWEICQMVAVLADDAG
jgi:hypothetical protein